MVSGEVDDDDDDDDCSWRIFGFAVGGVGVGFGAASGCGETGKTAADPESHSAEDKSTDASPKSISRPSSASSSSCDGMAVGNIVAGRDVPDMIIARSVRMRLGIGIGSHWPLGSVQYVRARTYVRKRYDDMMTTSSQIPCRVPSVLPILISRCVCLIFSKEGGRRRARYRATALSLSLSLASCRTFPSCR